MKELEFYHELAREIIPQGFKAFLYNKDNTAWLYVITPDNSWLYIDEAEYGGYNITYEYVPSKDFGSGCRCNEEALHEITAETLLDAEKYGINFSTTGYAPTCPYCGSGRVKVSKKPKHYQDALKAMLKSWCSDRLLEFRIKDNNLYTKKICD